MLQTAATPLDVDEIYRAIVERDLYDFKAVDPKSVVRSQLRRHALGLDFPSASPVKYFRLVEGDRYALESKSGIKTCGRVSARDDRIPEEVISDAYKDHFRQLSQALKQRILENPFAFFERLVIDLLIRMGYGGSDSRLGFHTGRPGDEGIDGLIWEDRLGLSKIALQAKRYRVDREIKPEEVRAFAGAMVHVTKGVFITTSKFAPSCAAWVEKHDKAIRLIDGDRLCELLITHGVAVSEVGMIRLFRVDSDYFSKE